MRNSMGQLNTYIHVSIYSIHTHTCYIHITYMNLINHVYKEEACESMTRAYAIPWENYTHTYMHTYAL